MPITCMGSCTRYGWSISYVNKYLRYKSATHIGAMDTFKKSSILVLVIAKKYQEEVNQETITAWTA